MKNLYKIIVISILSIGIVYAQQGLKQKHLVDITPKSAEATPTSSFMVTFDRPIYRPSITKRTVLLKQKEPHRQKIAIRVAVSDNTLTVFPDAPLNKGIYVLKVKPLNLIDKGENTRQIKTF